MRHSLIPLNLQSGKFSKSKESQEDSALKKILGNGYATEEERSQASSLPGAKIRKRYSVGEFYWNVIIQIYLFMDCQRKLRFCCPSFKFVIEKPDSYVTY